MDCQKLKLLEDDLWEAADQLRANSKLTASEYSMATIDLRRQQMNELRDRASAQARMKATIIGHLLAGLPEHYSNDDIEVRADTVFQYVQSQIRSAAWH